MARIPAEAPLPRVRSLRATLAALAAMVLLACGVLEVLPRSAVGAPSPVSTSAPASTSGKAPATTVAVRALGLVGLPSPTGSGDGLLSGAAPLLGPRAVTAPRTRPPTALRAAEQAGRPGSRAPPRPAGT